ncbi:gamma-glutamyltransferase [Synechococcus sp. PCC 7335]|uniref:gamma-glutamyltransferase n=1 Tax=Synechococcus sp. (strain ATCC 29403 / PCC 7335) TaxID=91464 RepID=UPI0018DC6B7C|nr:gamma-glutamyltransferase [Synechococcus sp. PCC 7335]
MHFYRLVSWGVCQRGVAACDHKQTPKAVGQSAVATSHYEATRVGIEVIKAGGNAVDAAIAVGYALAVVHPCCGNLGGGGFMTLRLSDDTNRFINFRETAPLAATPTLYQDSEGEVIKGLSTDSYLAVAVPGTVAGLEYARKAYGSGQLTRQQLIAPAQKLANDGFVLTGPEQKLLTRELKNNQNSEVVDIFIQEGKAIEVGDRLVQPELGETLSLLAKNGASTFYEGEIAQKIVEASQQHNGILTLEDFKTYQVQDIDPLTCNYRGFTILTSPPPGGGPVLCQMLNIVEGFPISQVEYYSAQHLHQMLSAMLFAYRDRNLYFGDPTFVEVPTARILSKAYAKELRSKIPKDRALELAEELSLEQKGKNTTHFSVVDKEGNAVSVTYTINTLFGAGVIAPGTGFFLNNEMDDFTAKVGTANTYGLVQGSVNSIEPGKQPLSSMAPTIVLDASNEIALVTGSPGGSTIPTTIFQIITNLVDFNLSPDRAVNQPRIHYQGSPNTVLTEPFALPGDTFVDLWNYGYRVSPSIHWGAAMSIARKDKKLQAIKDFRRQQAEARAVDD